MKIAFIDKTIHAQHAQFSVPSPTCEKKFFHNIPSLKLDLKKYKPDVVFINKGSTLNYEEVRLAVKPYFSVYFLGDYRNPFPAWATAYATTCNMVLFTWEDPEIYKDLKTMGQKNVFCIHQGTNPNVFKPIDGSPKIYQAMFGGNFYGVNFSNAAERLKNVRFLNTHYNFQVVGAGWPDDVKAIPRKNHPRLNKLLNQSHTTIGIHNRLFHRWGVRYGTSNRLFQCMAIGIPHIAQQSPGISELFDDCYLEWIDRKDLQRKLDWLLSNPSEAEKLGQRQREYIINNHTVYHAWMRMERRIRECASK